MNFLGTSDWQLRRPKNSRARQLTRFLVAWLICFIAMEASGFIFIHNGAPLDFQAFYTSAFQVRTVPSQLYNLTRQKTVQHAITSINGFLPFYHPSFETLLFLPFSVLSYPVAYSAFLAFNMGLLGAIFFAGRPWLFAENAWWWRRPEVMIFLFLPLLLSLALGQDSVLSLLLYCLAWRQLASGRDMSAGCLLGLALFKFQLAVPIAVLIAIRQGWRFATGFLISLSGVVLTSIAIIGWAGTADYARVLLGAASAVERTAAAQQKMNVFPFAMPNIAGLLFACGGRFLQDPIAFHVLSGVCGLGLFIWCAYVVRKCELKIAVSVAILCGLLVNYHFYFYDLTLLLLPIALIAGKTNRHIHIAFWGLPIVLFAFGMNWYFLMAVPMLAVLLYVIISAPKSMTLAPDFAGVLNGAHRAE